MLIVILSIILAMFSRPAWAEEANFRTDLDLTYTITSSGRLDVNQEITLTNLTAQKYVTEYHLDVQSKLTDVSVIDQYDQIKPLINSTNDGMRVTLPLSTPVVGEGKQRVFSLRYQLNQLLEKNGEVWEINLPPLPQVEKLGQAKVTLIAPYSLGPLAYMSPEPATVSTDDQRRIYTFQAEQVNQRGVNAAFGKCQIFEFELRFHLQNPQASRGLTQISLPPDTAFQRVYYQTLTPSPSNVFYDPDGNLIAEYELSKKTNLEVRAQGQAILYSEPLPEYPTTDESTLSKNLLPQPYWEVQAPEIISLAKQLNNTRSIYNYVVEKLRYDDDRADQGVTRLGALGALNSPGHSLCMEFTDLFIALARANNVPAREAIGFAYTNKTDLKPAQNAIDILHSWPEYWDKSAKLWRPIDPTWENTTLGRDYFNKLDLNHFVFTYHGLNSEEPAPAGSYKTGQEIGKDILISFGSYPEIKPDKLLISTELTTHLTGKPLINLQVTNAGPNTLYNLPLEIIPGGINLAPNFAAPTSISLLAPFETKEIKILLASPKIWEVGQAEVEIKVGETQYRHQFQREQITWPWLLGIGIIFSLVIGFAYFKFIRKRTNSGSEK